MTQLEKDVAHHVLAYLARQGYRNTMSTFLQECTFLPSNTTMMVLPETPLSDIVADFNVRKQSTLMLQKLGPKASWEALWEKLQHYLGELRMLADTLLGSHQYSTGRKRPCRTRTSQFQQSIALHETALTTASSSDIAPAPAQSLPTCSSSSPRKSKKPVQLHSPAPSEMQASSSVDPSLAPRQLLDILLEDESLQHHLAGLINSSLLGDSGPEVMDRALDEILALAAPEDEHNASTTDEN